MLTGVHDNEPEIAALAAFAVTCIIDVRQEMNEGDTK
jgi:hypothetical protein